MIFMRKKIIFSTLTILLLSILLSTAVACAEPGVPIIYDAIEDIEEQIAHSGTANSLTSKLENALNALERGNINAFTNILNAFINNVEAQSGKKIDEDYANTLIEWAQIWIEDPERARLYPSYAELTFWENPTVMTYNDTLLADVDYESDIVHRLQILNIDDKSDTDIVEPLFHVETEDMDLTWVDWEQYATWSENYAEWDFQEVIFTEELGTTGPCFGVDRQEWITLGFEMTRPTDQPVITESGTYTASFTLEFTDIDCEWFNGYIVVCDQWCLDASIVQGSFDWTNAPVYYWSEVWDEGRIHEVTFFLDLDELVLGETYDFSVLIDVDVTDTDALPILYKPSFGINYLVSTEWIYGVEGDTVEIPPDMRPDYVTEAWVSTDESNIWTLGKRNEINAIMHEVVELHGRVPIGVTASTDAGLGPYNAIVELASEDINDYCRENDYPYRFIYTVLSNQGDAGVALENTMAFNDMGINLVSGHGWSSQCAGSLEYVNENDMLLFSPSSTSPTLAFDDNLYRLCTNDFVQGEVIADIYEELGKEAILIYHRDDSWGSGLADVIEAECISRGIDVLGKVSYDPSNLNFPDDARAFETILAGSGYTMEQLVFQAVMFDEINDLLWEVEWLDAPFLEGVQWIGCDGTSKNQRVIDEYPYLGTHLKIYGTYQAPDYLDPSYVALAERYATLTGSELGFYMAAEYDILWILAEAVINAGSWETEAVRGEIEAIVDGYQGVSGQSTFDENGDRVGADYDIWGYGWIDEEASNIKYGYYDLETDSITFYEVEENPPELGLYYPHMFSYTQYELENPTNIWYVIVHWVSVFSKDGLDDIEYVKLIFPDGVTEVDLHDDGPWGYSPETGRYYSDASPDAPVTGTFTFKAKDYSGNVVQQEYTIGDWAETLYDYVIPVPGQLYPTSDTLVFEWELEQPEVISYEVNIWNGSEFWYSGWSDSSPHQYDGPPLAEGRYHFAITAVRPAPEGQLAAHGYFFIGSSPSP